MGPVARFCLLSTCSCRLEARWFGPQIASTREEVLLIYIFKKSRGVKLTCERGKGIETIDEIRLRKMTELKKMKKVKCMLR